MSQTPEFNPVHWPIDMGSCAKWNELDAAVKQNILTSAVHAIWAVTGRRWCLGERTVYPRTDCRCPAACIHRQCGRVDEIDLRFYVNPFRRVTSGFVRDSTSTPTALSSDDYWIGAGHLYPVEGGRLDPWPLQDDGSKRDGANIWGLVLEWGDMPPAEALIAAGDLACVMARRWLNEPCELPENAMSVTREGVTIKLSTGLNAIPTVKTLLEAYPNLPTRQRGRRLLDPMKYRPASRVDTEIPDAPSSGTWSATGTVWTWSPS